MEMDDFLQIVRRHLAEWTQKMQGQNMNEIELLQMWRELYEEAMARLVQLVGDEMREQAPGQTLWQMQRRLQDLRHKKDVVRFRRVFRGEIEVIDIDISWRSASEAE